MVQTLTRVSRCTALGMVALLVSVGAAATAAPKDKKDELPSISDIMKRAHTKTDGYLDKIATNKVTDFERKYLVEMREKGKDILEAVRRERDLSAATEERLKAFLEDFTRTYV